MDWKTTISVLAGAAFSLLTSWLVARAYFESQRTIDKERERVDVELSYSRLVHAYFEMFGKRLKNPSTIHNAMSECQAKLKIYKREYEGTKILETAADHAAQMIKDHPDDCEDITQKH